MLKLKTSSGATPKATPPRQPANRAAERREGGGDTTVIRCFGDDGAGALMAAADRQSQEVGKAGEAGGASRSRSERSHRPGESREQYRRVRGKGTGNAWTRRADLRWHGQPTSQTAARSSTSSGANGGADGPYPRPGARLDHEHDGLIGRWAAERSPEALRENVGRPCALRSDGWMSHGWSIAPARPSVVALGQVRS